MSRIRGFFSTLVTDEEAKQHKLIELESKIGSQLFGPVPEGHRREFFNLDERTWVWYEEWTDERGREKSISTRYEVHSRGILKAQDGRNYSYLSRDEAQNFLQAIRLYQKYVNKLIYSKAAKV